MRGVTTIPLSETSQYFGKDLEAMSSARNYRSWILAEFLRYLGSSVAEVGAGTGSLSTLILKAGIASLVAFEPSQNMYPLLQEALRADTRAMAINDSLGGGTTGERFDSIR